MRQHTPGWKVPNFEIAMEWFEALPKKGTTGYSSKDKLEAPFIVPPVEDGTQQYARYHLRHSNRANGGREADPDRQEHLERLHREYQQVYRDSNNLVTLPPEVQWAFGLTTREHLLLILLWIRRSEDALTGKRILSGSNYYVTSLMLRLCGQRSGKWLDALAGLDPEGVPNKGLHNKGLIADWHFTANPDDPRFRLFDWSFPSTVRQRLLDGFVPTWAYESKREISETTPSPHDEDLRQSTETCARAPAPEHRNTCTGTPGPASEHAEPAPEQHRLTDLHDVTDLPDPNGGPPLTEDRVPSASVQNLRFFTHPPCRSG